MLTLAPGCACDVCAEEYGPQRLPHSIPCGHVLCASCCQTIVEKTSPRLSPVCPFCREQFTHDSPRLIRMDFTTSGWSTPRRFPAMETFSAFNTDLLTRKTERLLSSEGSSRSRIEVRRLEDRVARIAAKKCSVEEVSSLYKELEEWLLAEKDDQTSSLFLSAALLRAILMNHLAHSEASKSAKTSETNLKNKIDDLDSANSKLEAELRRQRTQYAQKSQECQQLRTEISQLRALATTLGGTPPELQPSRSLSPTPAAPAHSTPSSASTSPTPYSSANATPISRFNSMHSRSASMSSRPTTPAASSPSRSHTPAPRSHTPAPRSHTPGPTSPGGSASAASPARSHTPAPPMPSLASRSATPSLRSYTPGPSAHTLAHASHTHTHSHSISHHPSYGQAPPVPAIPRFATPTPASPHGSSLHRTQTPAPLVPPKPRRLSTPSPPKMGVRSASEEKAEAHERWIPPQMHGHGHPVVDDNDYSGYPSGGRKTPAPAPAAPQRPASRMGGSFTARLRSVMG